MNTAQKEEAKHEIAQQEPAYEQQDARQEAASDHESVQSPRQIAQLIPPEEQNNDCCFC